MKEKNDVLGALIVQLHYAAKPHVVPDSVLERVQRMLPRSKFLMNNDGVFSLLHPEFVTKFSDGEIPVQTMVSYESKGEPSKIPPEFLQQTFDWPGAAEALGRSAYQVFVAEMMGRQLDAANRVFIFNAVLEAMLILTAPVAITTSHARKVLEPARILKGLKDGTTMGQMQPHLNVRFCTISNSPGDMIMDTIGPSSLNLPDLQCHFRGMEPGEVAAKLYNTALYLFEKGPVIESGHTVEGLKPGEKWKAQTEKSLLEPTRQVLDLNPGSPYAAGKRTGA